jgi:hypothetical protein
MKSKSTRAIIKSMKAPRKKIAYLHAANAIEKKLAEIKKSSKDKGAVETKLILFRHLA